MNGRPTGARSRRSPAPSLGVEAEAFIVPPQQFRARQRLPLGGLETDQPPDVDHHGAAVPGGCLGRQDPARFQERVQAGLLVRFQHRSRGSIRGLAGHPLQAAHTVGFHSVEGQGLAEAGNWRSWMPPQS